MVQHSRLCCSVRRSRAVRRWKAGSTQRGSGRSHQAIRVVFTAVQLDCGKMGERGLQMSTVVFLPQAGPS